MSQQTQKPPQQQQSPGGMDLLLAIQRVFEIVQDTQKRVMAMEEKVGK